MAPISKSLALAATLLAAVSSAAPHHGHSHNHNHKRDEVVVWETVTTVVWTTVDITTTLTKGEEAPPSTIIQESVTEPTVPAQVEEPEPEPTSISTSTTTQAAPSPVAELPDVEVNIPTTTSTTTTVAPPAVTEEPVAPVPTTTTVTVAPAPETTSEPAPVQQEPAAPAPDTSSGYAGSCSESSPCTGEITYYDTATSASAPSSCGYTNDGTVENVLALPVGIMTDDDCGKTVTIKFGGQKYTGTVVDKCMGCDNQSIDLSRHFFGQVLSSLGDPMGIGRKSGITWYIN